MLKYLQPRLFFPRPLKKKELLKKKLIVSGMAEDEIQKMLNG
jgi:hypothetical protein